MCRPLVCCLCFGDTRIPFKHNVGKPGSSPYAKNELDRLCHFDRTSTCDRRTDRHTDTWAVALSCPGAGHSATRRYLLLTLRVLRLSEPVIDSPTLSLIELNLPHGTNN